MAASTRLHGQWSSQPLPNRLTTNFQLLTSTVVYFTFLTSQDLLVSETRQNSEGARTSCIKQIRLTASSLHTCQSLDQVVLIHQTKELEHACGNGFKLHLAWRGLLRLARTSFSGRKIAKWSAWRNEEHPSPPPPKKKPPRPTSIFTVQNWS